MTISFLDLPLEIRVQVYALTFGSGKVLLEVPYGENSACLIPRNSTFRTYTSRSSQLLRVNKMILVEAREVLYTNTTFHIFSHVFAGRLPTRTTDGHGCAPYIRHLIWQLDCDIMMRFYPEDLKIDVDHARRWKSLELHCRADTWQNSFLGESCDREAFIKGREQLIAYATEFQHVMSSPHLTSQTAKLVEDRSQLDLGRLIVSLKRNRKCQGQDVGLSKSKWRD